LLGAIDSLLQVFRYGMMTRARPARQHSSNSQQTRGGRAEYLPTLLILQHRQRSPFHRPLVAMSKHLAAEPCAWRRPT
jgi:hypothetical protein